MTILVAVDRDDVRDRVLETGLDLARAFDEDLHVVHLVDDEFADGNAKRIRDELRDRVADANVVSTVSIEHIGHSSARPTARTAQELLDATADVSVSHIVVGHTSKGVIRRLATGSTAFAVADAADVPVTIVSDNVEP